MGYAKPGCRINGGRIVFDGIDLTAATEEEKRACAGQSRICRAERGRGLQPGA